LSKQSSSSYLEGYPTQDFNQWHYMFNLFCLCDSSDKPPT